MVKSRSRLCALSLTTPGMKQKYLVITFSVFATFAPLYFFYSRHVVIVLHWPLTT